MFSFYFYIPIGVMKGLDASFNRNNKDRIICGG